jgi:DNA-binding response OmpR family regulator
MATKVVIVDGMASVLVVEDDPKIGQHLISTLTQEGIAVALASDKDEFETALTTATDVEVVVLDRLLGSFDCKTWLPRIRRAWPDSRILVLSAINTPNERTELLNLGADDYHGKPFVTQEVIARVKALRRRSGSGPSPFMKIGNSVIDIVRRTLSVDGKEITIPSKEFLLLRALSDNPGRVMNKNQLLETVWGVDLETETNVVEATVTNLRRRLTELGSSIKVKNMRNVGYWIEE